MIAVGLWVRDDRPPPVRQPHGDRVEGRAVGVGRILADGEARERRARPVHDTPSSCVTADPAAFGLFMSAHLRPFQRATSAEPDVKLLV